MLSGLGRQSCPDWCNIFRPVCGSDGKVYNSECHIRMEQCNGNAGLRVADDREGCMKQSIPEDVAQDIVVDQGFSIEAVTADEEEERDCPA